MVKVLFHYFRADMKVIQIILYFGIILMTGEEMVLVLEVLALFGKVNGN